MTSEFSIARRFRGPEQSGNGGYVAGMFAQSLGGSVAVRLKAPPPLETNLQIEVSAEEARLLHGTNVIAEARRREPDVKPPSCPSFAEAERASKSSPVLSSHPLPECFVCGTLRGHGDGLRIYPGALDEGSVFAATWIPENSLCDSSRRVRAEFIWSALDCPGGFAVNPGGDLILLGELCARIDGAAEEGERCVVLGWPLGIDGRKRYAGSAVFSESGRLVGVARATWIQIPKSNH
jgi:hypothetical protein